MRISGNLTCKGVPPMPSSRAPIRNMKYHWEFETSPAEMEWISGRHSFCERFLSSPLSRTHAGEKHEHTLVRSMSIVFFTKNKNCVNLGQRWVMIGFLQYVYLPPSTHSISIPPPVLHNASSDPARPVATTPARPSSVIVILQGKYVRKFGDVIFVKRILFHY